MNQNQAIMELPGDPLVDSINEKLGALSSLSTNFCIYKVPEAYSPRVVSIGPLHDGKEALEAMEDPKLRYLQSFIPKINISGITESLYRNIILFEQCHRLDAYFFHYMRFLYCFLRSPMDAELFIDNGIIVIRRGNAEDISRLFNSILKETTHTSYRGFYYPWSAAVFLLLLTLIQAPCSLLALELCEKVM